MRAIRLHEFGPPENLVLDELPDLHPAAGEVRIAVSASGVHLIDTSLRRGETGGPMPAQPELPTIPGREVAGVVDELGDGVDPALLGRRMVAHLGLVPGGYAEQAVTAVGNLIPIPDGVAEDEAVALVGTGRTAAAILEEAAITATDVVLIPAAAGGIGWLAVQAAKNAGATVIAAARGEEKLARLQELGADQVVDYSQPGWAEQVGRKATVLLDGVGGDIGRAAMKQLAPGGRMVMFGYSAGAPTELTTADIVEGGLTVSWSLGPKMFARPGGIRGVAEEAVARGGRGEWRPLTTTYPLADAARAHRDLETRRTVGKVVLLAGA
ncbi:zinc-binding dehydrogenase [Nocardioides speluncae]|uniref:zinc-binding dehydrogenase n=1 Tax=Nocardioides speluncae TaxID=2670337 RepID=UPI000D68ABC7|nr:zinc-binding dehydrogenase [Nocardioides speluncae]